MDNDYSIPAAHIGDVDLSAVDPAIAAEIMSLGGLMATGDETPRQFSRLIRLLHQIGLSEKAEYLLRRNVEVAEGGLDFYRELFGTEKPDAFAIAVEGFGVQFGVKLEFIESRDFLDDVYHSVPAGQRFDAFRLMNDPCEVRFDYADFNAVCADVPGLTRDESLLLHWVNGAWEIVDPEDIDR